MARRTKGAWKRDDGTPAGTPSREDEADIVQEIGAEPSEEDPEQLTVSEETVHEQGAIDAESIRANRHSKEVIGKKRANVKNVMFNIPDVLIKYEEITKAWPASTMEIMVQRLTGTAIQWIIQSRPRDGASLYAELKKAHGQREESEYQLTFRDSGAKMTRGTGRITLPDTRGEAQSPMNPPNYPPPPYGAPPYGAPYPPQGYPQQPYPPQPVPQPVPQAAPPPPAAPAPAPMPQFMVPQPGMTFEQMIALQRTNFEMLQQAMAQGAANVPQPAPPVPQPQPSMPYMPPGSVFIPGVGVLTMEQAAQFFAGSRPQQAAPPPPEPAQPQRVPMRMPPVAPPPGTVYVEGFGFVSFQALAEAQAAAQGVAPPRGAPPGYRPPPYPGSQRPAYAPSAYARAPYREDGPPPDYRGYPPPPPPREPEPPRTPEQQFQDMFNTVQTAASMAQRMQKIFSGGLPAAAVAPEPAYEPEPPEEPPVRVMDVGKMKLVYDKDTGSARWWESTMVNLPDIIKWGAEQAEKIQRSSQQTAPPPPTRLPPGYVEVGPGFTPPPGYRAVLVDPSQVPQAHEAPPPPQQTQPAQAPLPPPPAYIPPPITMVQEPEETPWGMPPQVSENGY